MAEDGCQASRPVGGRAATPYASRRIGMSRLRYPTARVELRMVLAD